MFREVGLSSATLVHKISRIVHRIWTKQPWARQVGPGWRAFASKLAQTSCNICGLVALGRDWEGLDYSWLSWAGWRIWEDLFTCAAALHNQRTPQERSTVLLEHDVR